MAHLVRLDVLLMKRWLMGAGSWIEVEFPDVLGHRVLRACLEYQVWNHLKRNVREMMERWVQGEMAWLDGREGQDGEVRSGLDLSCLPVGRSSWISRHQIFQR